MHLGARALSALLSVARAVAASLSDARALSALLSAAPAALAAWLSVASAALASSVREEVVVDRTQTSAQNPRAGSFSNLLGATFDVGNDWALSGAARISLEDSTPSPPGAPAAFRDAGGMVSTFSLGADWDLTDRYSLGATLFLSPRSTTRATAPVVVDQDGKATSASSAIEVSGSSRSLDLIAGYDSPGVSDLEWSSSVGITFTQDSTTQTITAIQVAGGAVLTPDQIQAACALPRSRCPRALLRALGVNSDDLASARLSLSATVTAFRDTDFTLGGDYYGYASDPTRFGYFSPGSAARGQEFGGTPIAALRFLIRPEVARRFGDFSLRVWAQAGRYVAGAGESTAALGVKAQLRFTSSWRGWVAASGQNDLDAQGDASKSVVLSAGGAYRF